MRRPLEGVPPWWVSEPRAGGGALRLRQGHLDQAASGLLSVPNTPPEAAESRPRPRARTERRSRRAAAPGTPGTYAAPALGATRLGARGSGERGSAQSRRPFESRSRRPRRHAPPRPPGPGWHRPGQAPARRLRSHRPGDKVPARRLHSAPQLPARCGGGQGHRERRPVTIRHAGSALDRRFAWWRPPHIPALVPLAGQKAYGLPCSQTSSSALPPRSRIPSGSPSRPARHFPLCGFGGDGW
jgi:hypothetical protein